jgi:RIO kinase 1
MSSDRFLDEKRLKKIDRELHLIIDRVGSDRKTLDEVFDKSTLLTLGKLISDRVIDIIDFPISTGKEANIFRGVTPEKTFVAVKIYRTATSTFKHITQYIAGDPRFKAAHKNRREFINEWAKKEFKNLELLKAARVRAPHPVTRINNVVVMEYIGDAEQPAPLLKDIPLSNPKKLYDTLITYVSHMYKKAGLVHADFSPYNILFFNDTPYVIDLAQAVLLEHPQALEFLRRDIHNIVQFFNRYDIKGDETRLYKKITGKP